MTNRIEGALCAWRKALGDDAVQFENDALRVYSLDTSDFSTSPVAILLPATLGEVQQVVRIAVQFLIPLYPVSTGRNWGYGTANAPKDGCAIVDLSLMSHIREFDVELGLATLEPGVTQGVLQSWLEERGLSFMVPTTGAGPRCSLLGNALERGYGLTPIADHFAAVVAIEAVLPDGTVYRSPMMDAGVSNGFKWGVGPYVDGLFSQGNIGIVTGMTVALARRPEHVEAFYFWIDSDADLEVAVNSVRGILQQEGSNVGGINLMSASRFLAMSERFPEGQADKGQILAAEVIERLARRAGAAPWMGVGAIYGSRRHVAASRKAIRSALSRVAGRVLFMSSTKARRIAALTRWIPGNRSRRLARTLETMRQGLALLEGRPNELALPLAYWKSGMPPDRDLDPARDRCGLLWYAPIVPIRAADARRFVDLVRAICAAHAFEAPITLTSVSERSFDCTLPLLFDATCAESARRADKCWRALFAEGRRAGFLPYRLHPRYAAMVTNSETPFWRTAQKIKDALDPLDLISPGRWTLPFEEQAVAITTIQKEPHHV